MHGMPIFVGVLVKIIAVSMIIVLSFPSSVRAESPLLGTKFLGKLAMVTILSTTALIVKMLVDRDRNEVDRLHEELGPPDSLVEYCRGFDRWRIERYGSRFYIFRNGILYSQCDEKP